MPLPCPTGVAATCLNSPSQPATPKTDLHSSPPPISSHPLPPPPSIPPLASPRMDALPPTPAPTPSIFNYILGFLLVGMAWGLTTPFIRRAAINFHPPARPSIDSQKNSWLWKKVLRGAYTVLDLLRSPGYAVPLLVNLTGSVWFFLLIGKAGKCGFFIRSWGRGMGIWNEGLGIWQSRAERGLRVMCGKSKC